MAGRILAFRRGVLSFRSFLWTRKEKDKRESYIFITCPPEKVADKLPVSEIIRKMEKMNWQRDYIEVNINKIDNGLVELDWDIKK
jgi:hypothetical protein